MYVCVEGGRVERGLAMMDAGCGHGVCGRPGEGGDAGRWGGQLGRGVHADCMGVREVAAR